MRTLHVRNISSMTKHVETAGAGPTRQPLLDAAGHRASSRRVGVPSLQCGGACPWGSLRALAPASMARRRSPLAHRHGRSRVPHDLRSTRRRCGLSEVGSGPRTARCSLVGQWPERPSAAAEVGAGVQGPQQRELLSATPAVLPPRHEPARRCGVARRCLVKGCGQHLRAPVLRPVG